ncbi:MAG: metallophosphoesterase [Bacteroidales bacterium]|nr:metallophosphoesterase [Bacteroidales bacterium]
MPEVKVKPLMFILIVLFEACENNYDYSPYAIDFNEKDKNVNQRNIEKLFRQERNDDDDTIKIAFTGDSHRFYDEMELFVANVNTDSSIDFAVRVGDIADFGLPQQYTWGNSILQELNIPYFVVVGNHDLIGNGLTAYREMFGPLNFSFIYRNVKFVCINTNSREFKFDGKVPDICWLEKQLYPDESFDKAVVIFHVPPMDVDFDESLEEPFHETMLLNRNVLIGIHGHTHQYEIYRPYDGSLTYLSVYYMKLRKYSLIKITYNDFFIETVEF